MSVSCISAVHIEILIYHVKHCLAALLYNCCEPIQAWASDFVSQTEVLLNQVQALGDHCYDQIDHDPNSFNDTDNSSQSKTSPVRNVNRQVGLKRCYHGVRRRQWNLVAAVAPLHLLKYS